MTGRCGLSGNDRTMWRPRIEALLFDAAREAVANHALEGLDLRAGSAEISAESDMIGLEGREF